MQNELIQELYELTQRFIENIRTLALSGENDEHRQLLEFVGMCEKFMRDNKLSN